MLQHDTLLLSCRFIAAGFTKANFQQPQNLY